jgi:hypothetical protein
MLGLCQPMIDVVLGAGIFEGVRPNELSSLIQPVALLVPVQRPRGFPIPSLPPPLRLRPFFSLGSLAIATPSRTVVTFADSAKPPVYNGMIAPTDSWMMRPPFDGMIPPGAPRTPGRRWLGRDGWIIEALGIKQPLAGGVRLPHRHRQHLLEGSIEFAGGTERSLSGRIENEAPIRPLQGATMARRNNFRRPFGLQCW